MLPSSNKDIYSNTVYQLTKHLPPTILKKTFTQRLTNPKKKQI